LNRDRSYYRRQRKRVIRRKEKLLLGLGGKELLDGWARGASGRFSKGKIHCSCPLCRRKTFEGPPIRDKRMAAGQKARLLEWESEKGQK
jgi:hypothetical protein